MAITSTSKLTARWAVGALAVLVIAMAVGVAFGPVSIPLGAVIRDLVGIERLPDLEHNIVHQFRLPRVVLGALVGWMLSVGGAAYQGVFRNPLADPYLLGSAAGAGLGATLVVVNGWSSFGLPPAAFIGAISAVGISYALSQAIDRTSSTATVILSGVAVSAMFTAAQTYVQQSRSDTLRQVYSWILGRLTSANWSDVRLVLPYITVSSVVLLFARRHLDVLRVGEDEATSLGVSARTTRVVVVFAATLGVAAAVSVSGLIGFVGIIVPHIVRVTAGSSYRRIVPLSMMFGAAFLVLADLAARTVQAPAELPIGIITAFLGAPFFLLVLWRARGVN